MENKIRLYALPFSDIKTYMIAAIFIAGNIILPQLCHLIPQGGVTLLPIYFFTLVGAYKYGWKAGLLTATASPLINSLLFGMPAAAVLPAILLKSTLLAIIAGIMAQKQKNVSILSLAIVVMAYQLLGAMGEWAITGSISMALQDFRIGVPGMLLQIAGGYFVIKNIIR